MRKVIWSVIALGAIVLVLQVHLWTGRGGLMQFWQLKQGLNQQLAKNAELETRNATLHAEVIDLKQGYAAIEERARVELGMIKPGETFYQVVDKTNE